MSKNEKVSFRYRTLKVTAISGVAPGGGGLHHPLCGKWDVIFSYIYTNTTNLVFYLSYLVRLD